MCDLFIVDLFEEYDLIAETDVYNGLTVDINTCIFTTDVYDVSTADTVIIM